MLKFFLVALAMVTGATFAAEQSQLDHHQSCRKTSGAYRILFIGDSITLHGVSDWTRKSLGWTHVSGMAASKPGKDYASGLVNRIASQRKQQVVSCFHTYGGSGKALERLHAMNEVADSDPDLVIIQLGEHEKESDGESALRKSYAALLQAAKSLPSKPIVLAVGPWSGAARSPAGEYAGWPGVIDRVMASTAAEKGVPYRSVRDISFIPETKGWGVSDGVKWHPNDIGHSLYAERLFRMYLAAKGSRAESRK
ncbi:SGNH/GDSL hydrolase family protein [Pseudomonas guariconensis]|uniref:SGNH/GDSL hydrolase family protein n=1 Tax=Pseudomonas guariconensis TaxID=1288410 RepID=UPI0018AAC8DF|nr:SGNH/GDSL hydrolase family protein [Pseudomonas guariconensis]MBF8720179.1 SGNH/GDSL hydrolase family protein [Pseudomonas guariconensis]